jgi:hypothetical protein
MFAEYVLGLHEGAGGGAGRWTGFLSLVFPVIGAWWVARTAKPASWTAAMREGLIFGAAGGLINGAAIYLYFTAVNPQFNLGEGPVDAGAQALFGFVGALVMGAILVSLLHAVFRRGRTNDG